ncbi:hypothetical protein V6N12_055534 [Hibiscus sabdariffa]|uniref:Cytochrome P450 CYP749A22-like n=1 Tax=Hibiscus sabdariffa TaxID=183260 RepID=A0ABR2BVR3_9ROSI
MSALMKLVILVPCCFFLVALIKFLYNYLWTPLRIQHMMNSQGIKGPPYRFIHGNNNQVTRMKVEASTKPMSLTRHDIFPRVQPHVHSWLNTYGKNYLSWNGVQAELVISEPELVREVLKNSKKAFLKPKPTLLGSKLLGKGLVMVEGENWVKQRKLANFAFHGQSLKQNMIPEVVASVETMLERWKGQEEKEMEVYQEFRLLTAEVISRTAFGSSYLEGEKIFTMLDKLSILVIRDIFKTRIPFISKLWKTADLVESEQLQKGIQDCVMEIIMKREDKDLVDECKTFYLAGQGNVNSLLGWTVLLLSIHGDWQEKARREVFEMFGNQNPHPEGIAKLKTMSMIMNETLRLYGPSNGLYRRVGREVQLEKLVLPANIHLVALNIALHNDPQLWGDDVHLFKPERFAQGIAKATNHNAAAFFPFGLGTRSCVGMTFATTEAKIALSMILQRYTMTLSPAYVHKPVLLITYKPQHGIQVIFEALHKDA